MKKALQPLYNAWMKFAHVLGWVNGRIILSLLYIVIIGPYALVRGIGRMCRREHSVESYWITKEVEEPTIERLRHTF